MHGSIVMDLWMDVTGDILNMVLQNPQGGGGEGAGAEEEEELPCLVEMGLCHQSAVVLAYILRQVCISTFVCTFVRVYSYI